MSHLYTIYEGGMQQVLPMIVGQTLAKKIRLLTY